MPALSTASSPSFGTAAVGFLKAELGPRRIGRAAFLCAIVCVFAQAVTILATWSLWQARSNVPNLPAWDGLPQVSFATLLVASLMLALALPRPGSVCHAVLLAVACMFDQLRTQPQFLAIAVLLVTSVHREVRWFGRWFLASLWLWAGVHKLVSPDWHGEQAWLLAAQLHLDAAQVYRGLAWAVALFEIALGIAAIVVPRWALLLSIPLHLGISLVLSPLMVDWNATVIPWNLATASVGSWLLWQTLNPWPATSRQAATAIAMLALPAGFYIGWIDHYFAFVLYSDNLPRGLVTTPQGCREIDTWAELNVAFPNERRLIRQYFARAAEPGWKLHVADPRAWLGDEFWAKTSSGALERLSEEAFFARQSGRVAGIAYDNRRAVFQLSLAGARLLKRAPTQMVYAAQLNPEKYQPRLLRQLGGLPNLEQLQLAGCPVDDAQLKTLPKFRKLVGIGLEGTAVTDASLKTLRKQPELRVIEAGRTQITAGALEGAGFNSGD